MYNVKEFYENLEISEMKKYVELSGLTLLVDFHNMKSMLEGSCLEIGCGYGRLSKSIAKISKTDNNEIQKISEKTMKNTNYIGIDICEKYIEHCNTNYPELEFKLVDFMEVNDKFNTIIFPWSILWDFENKKKVLEKSFNLLYPNGKIIIDIPCSKNQSNLEVKVNSDLVYTPEPIFFDDIRKLGFELNFTNITVQEYITDTFRKRKIIYLEKKI